MWIDIEEQRPPLNARVIILIPFGMRVQDDTWGEHGFLNTTDYVSHWQPINEPGTYAEIMQRPQKGTPLPKRDKRYGETLPDDWFTPAIKEHFEMMGKLATAQFLLRCDLMQKVEKIPLS